VDPLALARPAGWCWWWGSACSCLHSIGFFRASCRSGDQRWFLLGILHDGQHHLWIFNLASFLVRGLSLSRRCPDLTSYLVPTIKGDEKQWGELCLQRQTGPWTSSWPPGWSHWVALVICIGWGAELLHFPFHGRPCEITGWLELGSWQGVVGDFFEDRTLEASPVGASCHWPPWYWYSKGGASAMQANVRLHWIFQS